MITAPPSPSTPSTQPGGSGTVESTRSVISNGPVPLIDKTPL